MPINTVDTLASALSGNSQILRFARSGTPSAGQASILPYLLNFSGGRWDNGFPGPGTMPAGPITFVGGPSPISGFHQITNPGSGQTSHIAQASATASVRGLLDVYDVIALWMPLANGANALSGLNVPSAPDPRWYDGGRGVECFGFLTTGGTVSAGTLQITYTNSDGTAGRVSATSNNSGGYSPGALIRIPLAAGDQGVRSVSACTRGGSWPTNPALILARHLLSIPVANNPEGAALDWGQTGLAPVASNAALGLVYTPASMAAATELSIAGLLRVVTA